VDAALLGSATSAARAVADGHPIDWTFVIAVASLIATIVGSAAGLFAILPKRRHVETAVPAPHRPASPVFMAPPVIHQMVERRELLDDLVRKLVEAGEGRTVALTTALRGAGGFGKTTLATQVCHQLKDQFPDGVLWCTVGQHVAGPDLAGRINDLAFQLSGERPMLVDPEQAGHHLGRLLGRRRCLLVIDDVWRIE